MTLDVNFRDVLDPREALAVEHVLGRLPSGERGREGIAYIHEGLERLRALWRAVDSFPRIQECQTLGSRRRDLNTMLDTFSESEPYTMEAYLPTRAALARSYGMAKFNFCRMVGYVAEDHLPDDEQRQEVLREIGAAGRSAVAAVIAEDVLRSIACDSKAEGALRRRATRMLAALWDQRATRSLADFAPLLDSAWRAKANVRIAYGTLVGMSELFQMLNAGLDSEFVDYFASDGVTPDQFAAFEEFLFNATYEQLKKMRAFMKESGQNSLAPREVARLFGVDADTLHTTTVTAQDMFFTFREREMWARFRRLSGQEGPKKTAEEYVMIYIIGRLSPSRGEMQSIPDLG